MGRQPQWPRAVHSLGLTQRCQLTQIALRSLRRRALRRWAWQLLARYTFTFAMENAVLDNYVTEKVYHPLMAGRCARLHSTLEHPRAP